MATKDECDQFATEALNRFEDFTSWALANWPNKSFPLMVSDFSESRRELSLVLGEKLDQGQTRDDLPKDDKPDYIDTKPMPWP